MSIRGVEATIVWTDEMLENEVPQKRRRRRCPLCRLVPRDEGALYCNWCSDYLESFREEIGRPYRSQIAVEIAATYMFCKMVDPYRARHLEHCRLTMDFPAQSIVAINDRRSMIYDWLLWIIVDAFTKPEGVDWTMIQSLKQGHIIPSGIWYEP